MNLKGWIENEKRRFIEIRTCDEENAKKAAEASAEELKGYIPKARFDESSMKKKLELDVRERDTQLETIKEKFHR